MDLEPFSTASAICSIVFLPIGLGYLIYIAYNLIKDTGRGIGGGARKIGERIGPDRKPRPAARRRRAESEPEPASSLLSIADILELTAVWRANWTRETNHVRATGFLPTPRDSEVADKRVEFTLDITGIGRPTGSIEALTAEHAFNYSISPTEIQVFIDNELLGTLDAVGNISNADGVPYGRATKSDRAPVIYRAGTMRQSTRDEFIPVVLDGNICAYITDVSSLEVERFKRLRSGETPLVVSLASDLTEEEAAWSVALGLLQVIGFIALNVFWEKDPPTVKVM